MKTPTPENLDRLIETYSPATWDIYAKLEESLESRGPDSLYRLAVEGASAGDFILDVGCRDAAHTIRLLAEIEGSTALCIDPVPLHVGRARRAIDAAGIGDRTEVREGVMQDVPLADASVDLIWCRDVIEQVDHLEDGLREMRRVLKSTGRFVVFSVFTTELLEPREAAMLQHSRGNVWRNLDESVVEGRFADAGFRVDVKDEIGTEWREYLEEAEATGSSRLLHLARLRRRRDEIVAEHGQELYEHVEANLHWEIYQFIGKLRPVAYVLRPTGPVHR